MYSWKYHLAHKNVTYAVFLNTRKTRLNWSLELLPTTTFCKVQVHSTKLETKSGLEKNLTCEYDIFTNTMFVFVKWI